MPYISKEETERLARIEDLKAFYQPFVPFKFNKERILNPILHSFAETTIDGFSEYELLALSQMGRDSPPALLSSAVQANVPDRNDCIIGSQRVKYAREHPLNK
jgi:hypothetical protein